MAISQDPGDDSGLAVQLPYMGASASRPSAGPSRTPLVAELSFPIDMQHSAPALVLPSPLCNPINDWRIDWICCLAYESGGIAPRTRISKPRKSAATALVSSMGGSMAASAGEEVYFSHSDSIKW